MNAAMRTEPVIRLRVRHELASVALVRNRLATDLRERRVPAEVVADAALVISELLTNAVRHTPERGGVEVAWTIDNGQLEVSVLDASTVPPQPQPFTVDAPNGRGIRIVEAISSAWGTDVYRRGKRVWARLPLTAQA